MTINANRLNLCKQRPLVAAFGCTLVGKQPVKVPFKSVYHLQFKAACAATTGQQNAKTAKIHISKMSIFVKHHTF